MRVPAWYPEDPLSRAAAVALALPAEAVFCLTTAARGDLVLEQWRIVVEYDGADHDHSRRRAADATRRTLLRAHGWYVVEITAADVRYPERAIGKVRTALRARGASW